MENHEQFCLHSNEKSATIKIYGPLNFHSKALSDAIDETISRNIQELIFDLSHASYITSMGVTALVRAVKGMLTIGGVVRVAGATPDMAELLRTLRIDKYISVISIYNADQSSSTKSNETATEQDNQHCAVA